MVANEAPTCSWRLSGMVTAAYVAAEDTGVLDCSCMMGHAVCSSCRDKLAPSGKCHVCGIEIDRYHRCRAMERLVESIHATCPNAAYGCDATPVYYDKDDHHRACPHAPLRCPATGCGFLGLAEALLDHFTGAHGWPPVTKARVGEVSGALLRDGFNFVLAGDDVAGGGGGKYLFLLNATRRPAAGDCGVTVHFVGPKQSSERLMAFLICGARRRYVYGRREDKEGAVQLDQVVVGDGSDL
nr:unnamed protein product [Digitaria exilis]